MKTDSGAGVGGARANGNDSLWDDADALLFVSRDKCISVIHGLVTLLLSMDFTCHVDLFIIACKVTCLGSFCLSTCCRSMHCVQFSCIDLLVKSSYKVLVFGRATITLGIGPHSSLACIYCFDVSVFFSV